MPKKRLRAKVLGASTRAQSSASGLTLRWLLRGRSLVAVTRLASQLGLGALQALGLMPGDDSAHEIVEVAVDDAIELVQREADAVVGDAVLREVVGADLLRAFAGADHAAALVADRVVLLLLLEVEQAALEHLEGARLVLDLAALVLALDDHAGGQVGDLHGAVGGVHGLPAGAAGGRDVETQVFVVDGDFDVVGF